MSNTELKDRIKNHILGIVTKMESVRLPDYGKLTFTFQDANIVDIEISDRIRVKKKEKTRTK